VTDDRDGVSAKLAMDIQLTLRITELKTFRMFSNMFFDYWSLVVLLDTWDRLGAESREPKK